MLPAFSASPSPRLERSSPGEPAVDSALVVPGWPLLPWPVGERPPGGKARPGACLINFRFFFCKGFFFLSIENRWLGYEKEKLKKKKKTLKASEWGSQGRVAASLEQSSRTPTSCPWSVGRRMSSESGVTMVQELCVFLSSPGAGIVLFCFVFASCFLSPPCVLAGTHFCGCWPKGMFWSCQERRRFWVG